MPDYGTREDYPGLVKSSENVEWSFLESSIDFSLNRKLGAYYEKLNCEAAGSIVVSFVVTKNAQIDAPQIENSLTENCDRAILLGLQFLEIEDPARINGKPINILAMMKFGIDTR